MEYLDLSCINFKFNYILEILCMLLLYFEAHVGKFCFHDFQPQLKHVTN